MDKSLRDKLAEPFEAGEVKWKAQAVKAGRAMAVAYVDARVVAERLDEVFGVDGWQDAYEVLPNHSVVCVLSVKVGDQWVAKSDVGSQSEQADEGDRMKAAFSDAFKRAAVKLGVGRYLYRLTKVWVNYDGKQMTQTPKLPEWALPERDRHGGQTGAGCITREQWNEIKELLGKYGVSQRRFLAAFQVTKPSELKASEYDRALKAAASPEPDWLVDQHGDAYEGAA